MKTWINSNSSREILKSRVLQYAAKSNRVESLFTTGRHPLDRTKNATILAKHKVTETKKSATGKARSHFVVSAFLLRDFKILLLYFKKYIDFDFKNLRLEKNEKIGCMLHCYKIEFNFLQKKFSKHLLHNIIVAYAYIVK